MVDIRSGFTFYLLKKEKNPVSSLPMALCTLALTSALQSRHLTLVFFNSDLYKISNICHCFNHQGRNRITIQPNRVFFHHFETTFMNS